MKSVTASDITGSISEQNLHFHLELFSEHIDTALINARAGGKTDIKYVLPAQFDIGNINNEDAQIVVLSELIALYKSRGFTDITVVPEKNLFILKWECKLSGIDQRKALIREHCENAPVVSPVNSPRNHSPINPGNRRQSEPIAMGRRGSAAGINPSDAALSPIMRTLPVRSSPLGQISHSPNTTRNLNTSAG